MEVRSCPPAEDLALALWSWIVGEDALASAGERMMRRQGWKFGVAEAAGAARRLSRELFLRWRGVEPLSSFVAFAAKQPELRLHHTDLWVTVDREGGQIVMLACLASLRLCCTQIAYGLYGEPVPDAAAAAVQALRDAHA